jgi:hypothetical protein
VDRVKWLAIGLGALILALVAGAYALTARGGGHGTRDVVTTTVASTAKPLAPKQSRPVSSATRPSLDNNDDQAGDNQAGDKNDDQAGDNQAGDNQTGDNNDDRAGDDRAGGP